MKSPVAETPFASVSDSDGTELFARFVDRPAAHAPLVPSVVIGELVAFCDQGRTPLVTFSGQPGSAAVVARSVVDVYGDHVGRHVALAFEGGDCRKPIIMGILRGGDEVALEGAAPRAEIESDGDRVILSAKTQLVLRCGLASIILNREGKVLIRGTFVSTRASGVNRIRGGSVQIN